jgi:hypothetical protein
MRPYTRLAWIPILTVSATASSPVLAAPERFQTPGNGRNLGVWRHTHNPLIRDHPNYHNTNSWSPNGRYVCYTHVGFRKLTRGRREKQIAPPEVHVFDLHEDADRHIGPGLAPRWARTRNLLLYVDERRREWGDPSRPIVFCVDVDGGRRFTMGEGVGRLGETDAEDRWIFGAAISAENRQARTVRVPVRPGAQADVLQGVAGAQWLPNPRHPVFFTRHDHKDEPFGSTRCFFDLDGGNKRMAVPTVQQCHMSWLGNGEYLLLGNGPVRGRRWDEPYPSNVHVLSRISLGDVSPCGRSGRYVCGDSVVADLRSGDGWRTVNPLNMLCYPSRVQDDSGPYDTQRANLRQGGAVTSFEARCLSESRWGGVGPPHWMSRSVGDPKSPLTLQRQTDVHVVVVREPDRPYLRIVDDHVQLIPGEEHTETAGYHALLDGQRITTEPVSSGARQRAVHQGRRPMGSGITRAAVARPAAIADNTSGGVA